MTPDELDRLIAIEVAEIGVRESPPNWGPRVSEYIRAVEGAAAAPESWCMDFQWWSIMQLFPHARKYPLVVSGSCQDVRLSAARAHALKLHPAKGRLFVVVRRSDDHAHHCGLVRENPAEDGSWPTIEGNTNTDGSDNGVEVAARRRGGDDDDVYYEFIALDLLPFTNDPA